MLANIAVISLDMYNDGSKVVEDNFDDPRICDFETLMQNVEDLRASRPTKVPIYDFRQSRRVGYEDVEVPASRIIVLEGIHALSSRLEHLLDLRIAITGGVHLDLVKRVRQLPHVVVQLYACVTSVLRSLVTALPSCSLAGKRHLHCGMRQCNVAVLRCTLCCSARPCSGVPRMNIRQRCACRSCVTSSAPGSSQARSFSR